MQCSLVLTCHLVIIRIFGRMKIAPQDRMFNSDGEVQKAVTEWMNNVEGEIWFHAIYNLIPL